MMCGCDAHYVCPRCTGTPADPLYVADEPRDETEQAPEIPAIGPERVAFANALHSRALAQYDRIFPPWRWPSYFRERHAIRRDLDALRAATAETQRWLDAHAS